MEQERNILMLLSTDSDTSLNEVTKAKSNAEGNGTCNLVVINVSNPSKIVVSSATSTEEVSPTEGVSLQEFIYRLITKHIRTPQTNVLAYLDTTMKSWIEFKASISGLQVVTVA